MNRLNKCYESLRKKTDFTPKIGIVLGSGLGGYGDKLNAETSVLYSELEDFPVSTAPGHMGRFIFAHVDGVPTVVMQGRVHYYEGYSMQEVVMPIRLMKLMGIEILFLTNASGGIQDGMKAGDFMLLEDQISCFAPSPLIGENLDGLGVRFPDMSKIYDEELRKLIAETAAKDGIDLKRGVYAQLTGPQFESPAEIRMLKTMGADAVGMSTACEAIAARHAGVRVCGVSCISNLAAGLGGLLSSEDVNETADRVGGTFETLVKDSIKAFAAAGEI